MDTLIPVFAIVFIIWNFGAFAKETLTAMVGVGVLVVYTMLVAQYECATLQTVAGAACTPIADVITDASQNAGVAFVLWIFTVPVRGILKTFVQRP
jgi:hypothetical protein